MNFEGLGFEQKVAVLMGLDQTAKEEDIVTTLQTLLGNKEEIDSEDVTAVTTLMQTLNKECSETHMARVRDKVGNAVMSGTMPPCMKGWMTRLCIQDEGAFDEFVQKVGTPFGHLFSKDDPTAKPVTQITSLMRANADALIVQQLGIDPKDMRNRSAHS